ncbi:MAG: hypothetical protein ACREJ9_14370 [Candidatus Rokuibacteriota bacterium]
MLRRCAWHRRYFGYPVVCGIAGWGGRGVDFSDWICRRCAARVRRDLGHRPPNSRTEPALAAWWDPFLVLPPAAATLLVAAMILVVASPFDHLPPVIALQARPEPAALPVLVQTPKAVPRPGRSLADAPLMGRRVASTELRVEPPRSPARLPGHRSDSAGSPLGPSSQAP